MTHSIAPVPSWRRIAVAILLGAVVSCAGDAPSAPPGDLPDSYWLLTASHKAVVLAIGGTQALTATPRNAVGTAIAGLPTPTFRSMDTTTVTVDAAGVLHGVAETGAALVVASLQAGGITHTDTITVAVTATATPIETFSIQPTPPDVAVAAMQDFLFITPTIIDADGNYLFLPVNIEWSDSTLVSNVFGLTIINAPGTVLATATMTAYGVTYRDTVTYRLTYLTSATVFVDSATSTVRPSGPKIAANGTVTWVNGTVAPVSITFDDPSSVQGGNIAAIPPQGQVTRTFLVPGTYTYHGGTSALSGRVLVY